MKLLLRSSLAALLPLCLAASGLAQSNTWVQQAPQPTGFDLKDVQMLSATEAFAVGGEDFGDSAVILHTLDGGQTWESYIAPTDSLVSVFFLDPQHGWAAGNGFFRTVNGGQTWSLTLSAGSVSDVQFVDLLNGFACGTGGYYYRTTDGGVTWSGQPIGNVSNLGAVHFLDAQNGWTANSIGTIYRTNDGAQTWTQIASLGTYAGKLHFFDSQNGWAIGGDQFRRTSDGGVTWTQVSVPAGTWVYGSSFSDPLHGFGVGPGSVRTSDGGLTWQPMPAAFSYQDLEGVDFIDSQIGILVGATGVLQKSIDGGDSWSSQGSGGAGFTHALDAVDSQHAWAAQDGGEILRTVDGGGTWERSYVEGFDKYGRFNDVDFHDQNVGWAVGDDNPFSGTVSKIVKSTDGGRSWSVQYEHPWSFLEGVEVIDAQTVYAVGYEPGPGGIGGFVVKTTDGGLSWNLTLIGAAQDDLEFVDALTGWTVGGDVKKTTDGGQTWVSQFNVGGSCCYVKAISFADAQNGWFVGWGGIYPTTNGGATWAPQTAPGAPVNQPLNDVHALSPTTAWIVGEDGYVARTQNGGLTWQPENFASGFLYAFEACHFVDEQNGWVGGANLFPQGGIWARTNGQYVCQPDLGQDGHGLLSMSLCGSPLSSGNTAELELVSSALTASRPFFLFISTTNNPTYFNRLRWSLLAWPPLVTISSVLDGAGTFSVTVPGGRGPNTLFLQAVAISPFDYSGFTTSNALRVELLP